jgi:hypothetical protein
MYGKADVVTLDRGHEVAFQVHHLASILLQYFNTTSPGERNHIWKCFGLAIFCFLLHNENLTPTPTPLVTTQPSSVYVITSAAVVVCSFTVALTLIRIVLSAHD